MRKILSLILAVVICFSALPAVFAQDETADTGVFDDCADFGKTAAHSEGLATDVVTDENKYAFSGDDTHIIRTTADAEWIEYDVQKGMYFIFNTAFSPDEEISHFTFEYTTDGENWQAYTPSITVDTAKDKKWITVHYNLKSLPQDAAKIKLTFGNVDGTPWSPCIESVEQKALNPDEPGFVDCVGTVYYRSTTKLKNLGLVSGYSSTEFGPDGTITRAEFSAMISRLLNLNDTVNPAFHGKVFGDVDSGYWGAGAIYALYTLGVVNGDENGNFNPEDNIMLQDAVKIIVSSLGYTVTAMDKGGYPDGFIREASRLSLMRGLNDIPYDSDLIRGDAALLMDNALDVDIITQSTFGEGQNVYTYGGDTILSRYHNIYEVRGEITDAGNASVYAEGGGKEGRFVIDDKSYLTGDFDMTPYLGMFASVYLKKDTLGGEDYAVYAEPGTETAEIELDYNEYDRFEDGAIYYVKDGAEGRALLSDETKIIYNYKYLTRAGLIEDELPFKCGYMRIISNRGSSAADYVMIYDFDTYVMAGAAHLGGALSDRSAGAVRLDLEQASTVMLTRDGETEEYDPYFTVHKNDVVCVAKSGDGTIADVRIVSETAVGQLTTVNKSENRYVIGGKDYALSEYFITGGKELGAGDREVTAYLDINGNIADCSAASVGMRYGYLRSAAGGDSYDTTALLQVITRTGAAETITATAKTSLNGVSSSLDKIAELEPQLIRFSQKSDGTAAQIETATDLSGTYSLNGGFYRNYASDSSKYYDNLGVFASRYQISPDTKVFVVPTDKTSDLSKYEVTDKSYLMSDNAYNVQIFDLSEDYKAGAAVISKADSGGTVYNYSTVCVIQSSATYLDDEGLECLSLMVYVNGELRELKFDNEGATDRTGNWISGYTERQTSGGANPFTPGEVMQFTESGGSCYAFRMLFTKEMIENRSYFEKNLGDYGALNADQYYSELYTAFGTVEDKFSDKMMLKPGENGYLRTIQLTSPVYVYSSHGDKLTPGDAADIDQGGSVFAQLRLGSANVVVVIRD